MNEYILSCTSTADMPKSWFEKRRVAYVCFHFLMNGVDYPDDLGQSMPAAAFYQKIKEGAMPTTSQVTVGQFLEHWEPMLQTGNDVLHVSLSTGLSGEYQSATIAREDLLEKYPDRKILLVDSLGASSGYGLLMDTLADLRDAGEPIEAVYEFAQAQRLHIHHWFFSTDLTHYRRGGRISGFSAFVGGVLGICPLMNMDNLGHLIPREKIRGKLAVIKAIVKKMEAHAIGGLGYTGKCFISHAGCPEDAKETAHLVEKTFRTMSGRVMVNNVGAVIGSHTGPGTVALFFVGDERTR